MAWRMKGSYLGACSCLQVCPCAFDGPPTGPEGLCRGMTAFHIAEGILDDVDLSGVNWGMFVHIPSNVSAGGWILGLVVDDNASDEQARAIESIVRGQEGGPFGDLAALISEVRGPERVRVTFTPGDKPSATIGDRCDIRVEPYIGPDGSPSVVRNAFFGFAPEFKIGKSFGRSDDALGVAFDPVYGETAVYEYTSETTDIHPRG
jgi:hypothetical protein